MIQGGCRAKEQPQQHQASDPYRFAVPEFVEYRQDRSHAAKGLSRNSGPCSHAPSAAAWEPTLLALEIVSQGVQGP